MQPELWGPNLWRSIHFIALGYPDQPTPNDVQNYYELFTNLWKVIPCYKCSINYKRHLDELPIDTFLTTKMKLFEWTVILHNIVNKELGKNQIAFEDAIELYKTKNQIYLNKKNNYFYYSILLLIIITLLIYIMYIKLYKNLK
jgi:hypothetical protein